MAVAERKWDKEDRIRATIYGNCIGDAIGLATEFMSKEEVQEERKWDKEDRIRATIYGNCIGDAIGLATEFMSKEEVQEAADHVWVSGGRYNASNGGVMRTSVLGVHEYWDLEKVIENTVTICGATHADPRCKASCVAVATSIAFMLQGQEKHMKNGAFKVSAIMEDSFQLAKNILTDKSQVAEMKKHMFATSLSDLKLAHGGIGYTFKTMGAGFWAFQQNDFRTALEAIVREGGDADTNGAVAGALLGCKLGQSSFPDSWLNKLKHKAWLDEKLDRFIALVACNAM